MGKVLETDKFKAQLGLSLILLEKSEGFWYNRIIARSPSGKATAFGAVIRWFESNPGSQNMNQLRLASILVMPIVLTQLLYPIEGLESDAIPTGEFKIANLFENNPTFKTLLASTLQRPFHLDWYTVTVDYYSSYFDSNCFTPNIPTHRSIKFTDGNPTLYENNFDSNRWVEESDELVYKIKTGERVYFITSPSQKYVLSGETVTTSGPCEDLEFSPNGAPNGYLINNLVFSVKPLKSVWLLQLLIITLIWIAAVSSVINVKDWIQKRDR